MIRKVTRWQTEDGQLHETEKAAYEHEFLVEATSLIDRATADKLLAHAEEALELLKRVVQYRRIAAVAGDVAELMPAAPAEPRRRIGCFKIASLDQLARFPMVDVHEHFAGSDGIITVVGECESFEEIDQGTPPPLYGWVRHANAVQWQKVVNRLGRFKVSKHVKENMPHVFEALLKTISIKFQSEVANDIVYEATSEHFDNCSLLEGPPPEYDWKWTPISETAVTIQWSRKT